MKLVIGDPANIDNIMVNMGNHRFPNMGALYIFGFVRERLPSIELTYIRGDADLPGYLSKLEAIKPDIFGISFATWVSDIAYKTINAVRERFPDMPIICGGTHPTTEPQDVLMNSAADICVIGEGEQTAYELIRYFQSGKGALSEIKGIAYKKGGEVKFTPPREHIQDISSIPLPAWDMVDFKEYEGLGYAKGKPNTAMIFSRGCAYNCVYCSNPVWRSAKPWIRLRKPEDIQKEIKLLYEKGIREIWIRADEFNSSLPWTLDVCRAIKDLGYKDLYFECNLRVDHVTEELAKAFKDINVWMVNLGIETLNQRVLDGIKKQTRVEEAIQACEILKKYGIDIYAWLMYYQIWEESGKLCWENNAEINNTLKIARKMHKRGLIDLMSWQIATPMPGSDMFKIVKKYDLLPADFNYNVWEVNTIIPGVSKRQMHINRLKGMMLQSYIAYKKGRVSWKTKQNILQRLKYMTGAVAKIIAPGRAPKK